MLPYVLPLTVEFVVIKVAIIHAPAHKSKVSLSVHFVVYPVPLVLVPVELVHAFS